jgi:hypothetical protein
LLQTISILFGVVLSTAAPLPPAGAVPLSQLEPAGIRFVVDTKENIGYIVNAFGDYAKVPVGSGQNKMVHYMRRTYKATTPAAKWTATSFHIQRDRITFGPDGEFLRLYRNGTEYTSYGIHATANIEEILASDDRYRSMGCVLVGEEVLDYLIDAYRKNGNNLDVVTVYGLEEVAAQNGSRG